MKTFAVPVLVALLVISIAINFGQWRAATVTSERVAQLTAQTAATETKIKSIEEKSRALVTESAALRGKLAAISTPAPTPPPAITAATTATPQPKNPMAGMLEKMLGTPEGRKTMAAQQTFAMRQFYSDFIKSAHLTPAESEKFYELLATRQLGLMDKAGAQLSGSKDEAGATAAADPMKAFDADLKSALGEQRVGLFHDYEKTLADHIAMNQLKQQLSGTNSQLSDDQTKGLLQVMSDERLHQPAPPFKQGDLSALNRMSDETMNQFFQSQEALNGRVRTRAMSVLTAAQLTELEKFQKQQLDMQKMGVTMARQMFAPKKDE